MTTLDEDEVLLLAEARREFTPERQQARRVHAAVLASIAGSGGLAAGTVGGSKAPIGAGGKLAAVLQTKLWLAGVAVSLGAASGAGLWALAADHPEPQRVERRVTVVAPTPSARVEPTAPLDSRAGNAQEQPPPVTPLEQEPAKREQPAARQRLELRDELAGVRNAENALNSGNPAKALALLDELGRFAGGDLREERAALRVLSHCQLGSARASASARHFLRDYGSSVYASRVRAACGE